MLVLAAVAATPSHGYAIVEALKRRSDGALDLSEGTVYPVLHRLERAGMIASEWEDGTTRPRRVYRLTQSGSEALTHKAKSWAEFAAGVGKVLGTRGAAGAAGATA